MQKKTNKNNNTTEIKASLAGGNVYCESGWTEKKANQNKETKQKIRGINTNRTSKHNS